MEGRSIIAICSVTKITSSDENGTQLNANVLAAFDDEPEPEPEPEPTPETTPEPIPESTPEPTPEPEPEPKEEQPAELTEEQKVLMNEIEDKLLFAASMKCGVPKSATREQKVEALKKTSLDDLRNMGLFKKYNEAVVTVIYNKLTTGGEW